MTISAELVKRYLEANDLAQNALAAKWDVSEAYITGVIKGRSKLSDDKIIELAEALGLNPAAYLIQMQAEKSKTEKERATWLKLLQSNAAAALLAMPLIKSIPDFASCIDMFKEFRNASA